MSGYCLRVLRLYLSKYSVTPIFRHSVASYHGRSGTNFVQDETNSTSQQTKWTRRVERHKHGQRYESYARKQQLDSEWFSGEQKETQSKRRQKDSSAKKESWVDKEWLQDTKHDNDQRQAAFRHDVSQSEEDTYGVDGATPEPGVFFKPIHHDKGAQDTLMAQLPEQPPDPHLLRIAVIGTPNTGKSTLINTLLGRRIFSVSDKVHTTRTKALAVFNQDNKQIIFVDTPGIVDYKKARRHHLARSLLVDHRHSLLEADLVAVMVDASHERAKRELHFEILKQLCLHPELKSILILNKIDLVKSKDELYKITASLTCGQVGGSSFEIAPHAAFKLGSIEKKRLMKPSYRPPPVDTLVDCDDDTHEVKNDHKYWWESGEENSASLGHGQLSVQENKYVGDNTLTNSDYDTNLLNGSTSVEESDVASLDDRTIVAANNNIPEQITDYEALDPSSADSTPYRTDADEILSNASQEEEVSKENIMNKYVNNFKEVSRIAGMPVFEKNEEIEKKKEEERMKKKQAEKELHRKVALMNGWDGFDAVFMVSAKQGVGMKDLKNYLIDQATPRDWEYHDDIITNLSPEDIVKEAIREQLLKLLFEEVPYLVQQKNVVWEHGETGELKIVQELVCPKSSQARMVEKRIGAIAKRAEQQLMNAFHHEVRLYLQVSVDKKNQR